MLDLPRELWSTDVFLQIGTCLRIGFLFAVCWHVSLVSAAASPAGHSPCQVRSETFEGWKAEVLANDWVRLTVVPQLGGRLMQVEFGKHQYLFVNSRYKGKYLPPADPPRQQEWVNYGGDKLWPLPEGHGEGQWPGPISDSLDDGEYKASTVSQTNRCAIHLEGPADLATGLQYLREISINGDSPEISFHAMMKNASAHDIRWSMQSVTQYDTADHVNPVNFNRDFWAFAETNPQSAYIDGYRVRNGLAEDPSYEVHAGLFTLHWLYLENEVWLDSNAGWIGIVDNSEKFGMIERYRYFADQEYPGKASVIFYKNGAALELDTNGTATLRSNHPEDAPYYMEAEINSPMQRLEPGVSYAFDTSWFPVRATKQLKAITTTGTVERSLTASLQGDRLQLSGSFAVFFPGKLLAHVFDAHGMESGTVELQPVDPLQLVELNQTILVSPRSVRVAISLRDAQGIDRGSLDETEIRAVKQNS